MDALQRLSVWSVLGLFFLVMSAAAPTQGQGSSSARLPRIIQFNRDIRPILSDNCFTCHGPDKTHRATVFHFDVEESAKQDIGGGRFAIVPGDPEKSLLIYRITSPDEEVRMPLGGTRLSEHDIALLKEWIQQGAKWEKHWSFVPPKRPGLPQVVDSSWVRNPIDYFVLHRLEQEGLKPSLEADRATLLRRVTLDLTGLPPTVTELDEFLADKSLNAYEKVVDRLLQSPQYGERMALPWLDAARYADTSGYNNDRERFMWRWRDWVINAFNKNMPFDQFTVEQIAGDLLPNPTLDQKIATGFNRNHRINSEGGIIPEEFAPEYVVDRVGTTASVFLGVTLGCARCHDHKYDPFTQKEFYQLFAYFNNLPESGKGRRTNSEPYITAPTPDQQVELKKLDDQIALASARFAKFQPTLVAAEDAWLKSLADTPPVQWAPSSGLLAYYALDGDLKGNVTPSKDAKISPDAAWTGNAQFSNGRIGQAASFDGTSFVNAGEIGNFQGEDKFTLAAWIYPTNNTGAIITKKLSPAESSVKDEAEAQGYGLYLKDGILQLNIVARFDAQLRVETEEPIELNRWHHVMASYGGTWEARSIRVFVDGAPQKLKVLLDDFNLALRIRAPLRIGGGSGPANWFRGLIDEVRVYGVELTPEHAGMLAVSKSLNELAALLPTHRSRAESGKIRSAFLENGATAGIRDAFQQLETALGQHARFSETLPTVMIMEEMPTPRETHVLLRGVYDQPGDKVSPGVPAILSPMPKDFPNNRLGLARWLVDPSNPLTARVTVNRFWQMYFGTGLVKTIDDFGSQGETPSHSELLDWLATEFMRTGWNAKEIQRTIVTSATYRQASKANPEGLQRDPENRLLARGPRFRLPAEMIRDQALSIAGLLVQRIGGPSVKPYQPDGLWEELNDNQKYVQDHGDNLYRRSLYTYWKRTIPPPTMASFDAPTRESCVVQRSLTNSPLQALDLMNAVTFIEAARLLGQRMMKEGGSTPEERIAFAFRLATGRRPTMPQSQVLSESFRYSMDRFKTQPETATKYLSTGEYPGDAKLDIEELAAYTSVASLIMNLDETVTKE